VQSDWAKTYCMNYLPKHWVLVHADVIRHALFFLCTTKMNNTTCADWLKTYDLFPHGLSCMVHLFFDLQSWTKFLVHFPFLCALFAFFSFPPLPSPPLPNQCCFLWLNDCKGSSHPGWQHCFQGVGERIFQNTYNAIFINALKRHICRQCTKYFCPRL